MKIESQKIVQQRGFSPFNFQVDAPQVDIVSLFIKPKDERGSGDFATEFLGALVLPAGCAIVMEDGGCETLVDNAELPLEKILNVALVLAGTMAYVHGQEVIHRYLKPENVLLSNGEVSTLKLIDFGIAKKKSEVIPEVGWFGTMHYMAPELLRISIYDDKVDVYAFSIIIWELITHENAFAGMNIMALKN